MKLKTCALVVCTLALLAPAFAAEEVVLQYSYDGDIRTDFSNIRNGPMKIAEFSDGRSGASPNLITDDDGGYTADQPLADIVRDALVKGFTKGKATLVDSGENLILQGAIVSSEAQRVDSNGTESIQLTIRTRIQLQGNGRTMWETVLFGRGTAPVSEGMEQALSNALDRTVRGLIQDDYFLLEVL